MGQPMPPYYQGNFFQRTRGWLNDDVGPALHQFFHPSENQVGNAPFQAPMINPNQSSPGNRKSTIGRRYSGFWGTLLNGYGPNADPAVAAAGRERNWMNVGANLGEAFGAMMTPRDSRPLNPTRPSDEPAFMVPRARPMDTPDGIEKPADQPKQTAVPFPAVPKPPAPGPNVFKPTPVIPSQPRTPDSPTVFAPGATAQQTLDAQVRNEMRRDMMPTPGGSGTLRTAFMRPEEIDAKARLLDTMRNSNPRPSSAPRAMSPSGDYYTRTQSQLGTRVSNQALGSSVVGRSVGSTGMTTGGVFGSQLLMGPGPGQLADAMRAGREPRGTNDPYDRAQELARGMFNAPAITRKDDGSALIVGRADNPADVNRPSITDQGKYNSAMSMRKATADRRQEMVQQNALQRAYNRQQRMSGNTGGDQADQGDQDEQYLRNVMLYSNNPRAAAEAAGLLSHMRTSKATQAGEDRRQRLQQAFEVQRDEQKRAYDKPLNEAHVGQLKAQTEKDKWEMEQGPLLGWAHDVRKNPQEYTIQEREDARKIIERSGRRETNQGIPLPPAPGLAPGQPQSSPAPQGYATHSETGLQVDPVIYSRIAALVPALAQNPAGAQTQILKELSGMPWLTDQDKDKLIKSATGNPNATLADMTGKTEIRGKFKQYEGRDPRDIGYQSGYIPLY